MSQKSSVMQLPQFVPKALTSDTREKLKSLSTASTDGAIEPARVMWAIKRSNVRAGPGTSYAKVGLLEIGDGVQVVEGIGDWFRLAPQPGRPERFIYAPLLSGTAPTAGIE